MNKTLSRFIALIVVACSTPSFASALDEFQTDVQFSTIADGISHREDRLLYRKRFDPASVLPSTQPSPDHGFEAGAEFIRIADSATWLEFDGYKGYAVGRIPLAVLERHGRHARLNLAAGYGAIRLRKFHRRTFSDVGAQPLGRIHLVQALTPTSELRLEALQDFAALGWLDGSDRSQFVMARHLFGEIETSKSGWLLRSNARGVWLTDSNHQTVYEQLILRESTHGSIKVLGGVGGGWLGFARRADYWSPREFSHYGFRLIIRSPIVRSWETEMRLAFGVNKEPDREHHPESKSEFEISYRGHDGWRAKIVGIFAESNAAAWWRNDVNLRLEIPL